MSSSIVRSAFRSFVLVLFISSALAAHISRGSNGPSSLPWTPQPIHWTECNPPAGNDVDCATLSVPVDWSDPTGEQITLGMNRVRATSNGSAVDDMFINFGGPAEITTSNLLGLTTDWSPAAGSAKIPKEVRERYNLIGVDPRGIGTSTPITCDVDLWQQLWSQKVSLFPKTEAEWQVLHDHNKAVGENCLQLSGDIIRFMDSRSVARDFEAVRQALGSTKFNYMGFSYGTVIGTAYAELFPQNIGRMLLDGIADHYLEQSSAFASGAWSNEAIFDAFATWCNSSTECVLQGQDVSALFDKLVSKAEQDPIPAPSCQTTSCYPSITADELRFFVTSVFHGEQSAWPALAKALSQALHGDGSVISALLPRLVQGKKEKENNTQLLGLQAISCLDWWRSSTLSDLLYEEQLIDAISPYSPGIGAYYIWVAWCVGWPFVVQYPPTPGGSLIEGTPPILLVNSLYDPATHYPGAVGLLEQMPSATLLTRNGYGHQSYFFGGEAYTLENAYLVNGTMPEPNTVVNS